MILQPRPIGTGLFALRAADRNGTWLVLLVADAGSVQEAADELFDELEFMGDKPPHHIDAPEDAQRHGSGLCREPGWRVGSQRHRSIHRRRLGARRSAAQPISAAVECRSGRNRPDHGAPHALRCQSGKLDWRRGTGRGTATPTVWTTPNGNPACRRCDSGLVNRITRLWAWLKMTSCPGILNTLNGWSCSAAESCSLMTERQARRRELQKRILSQKPALPATVKKLHRALRKALLEAHNQGRLRTPPKLIYSLLEFHEDAPSHSHVIVGR